MLNNNKVNIAISFLLALIMWAYVIGEVNPVTTETFNDIPIELVNVDKLNSRELSIATQSSYTIDVTVSASKSIIDRLENSDIKPYVDVAGLEKGTSQATIVIPLGSDIEIVQTSIQSIYLTTEDTLYEQKSVDVEFSEAFDTDAEESGGIPYATSISKDTVGIYGAESVVNSVDRIIAMVDTSILTDEAQEVSPVLSAVNANGEIVNHVNFSEDITVNAVYYYEKTVPLRVEINNPTSEDFERTVDVSRTVSIIGPYEEISNISSIRASTIDLTDVMESIRISIVPIIPDTVVLQSAPSANVTVTMLNENAENDTTSPDTVSKKLSLTVDSIEIINLAPEYSAVINSANIEIEATGPKESIDPLTIDNILVSADLEGLTEGKHTVELIISLDGATSNITFSKVTVEIEIKLI